LAVALLVPDLGIRLDGQVSLRSGRPGLHGHMAEHDPARGCGPAGFLDSPLAGARDRVDDADGFPDHDRALA